MKTLRRLALLALFAAAGTAVAGPPASNAPAPTSAKLVTADQLRDVVPGWFKGATVEGKGDTCTFSLPKMQHTLEGGKETMNWSVFFRLHTRADCPTAVRIFFPCKAVPADAHPDRLADLLGMSGAIQDSPAYFIISGSGKDRMLTLVAEMPLATLGRDTLEAEIKGLFRAAEKTMSLWTADLSKPPAKAEKKAEQTGLAGYWKDVPSGQGRRPIADKAGLLDLAFTDDGTVTATVARNDRETFKDWANLTGTYTLKGDTLMITPTGSKAAETYTVSVKDGQLTISPDKGDTERTFAKVKTTLHLWK